MTSANCYSYTGKIRYNQAPKKGQENLKVQELSTVNIHIVSFWVPVFKKETNQNMSKEKAKQKKKWRE